VARRKEAAAHANGHSANGHSANGSARAGKPPKKFRRLRVVAEDTHGYVSGLRDVYLESSHCPMIGFPGAVVEVELSGCLHRGDGGRVLAAGPAGRVDVHPDTPAVRVLPGLFE
jgi:hypothetical protein